MTEVADAVAKATYRHTNALPPRRVPLYIKAEAAKAVSVRSVERIRDAALVLLLVAVLVSASTMVANGQGRPPGDLTVPVGVYRVSVSAPGEVVLGDVIQLAVRIDVVGVNESSAWYQVTAVEGIEEVSVSFLEAGITLVRRPHVVTLTNVDLAFPFTSPVYAVNASSLSYTFALNSTFLRPGVYTVRVSVRGFRWALVGLSMGYSSFYIEEELTISVRGRPPSEALTDAMLAELNRLALTLYIVAALAVAGIAVGLVGIVLARKRS